MAQELGHQDQVRWYEQLVAAVWADPALKRRLLADPGAVVAEQGIAVPAGVQVRVVENTERTTYFVMPRQPFEDELSDEQLQRVPGGYAPCRPSDTH
jgi:hypothetical protein